MIDGLHDVNKVETGLSAYPRETARVFITPGVDGYFDVYALDADGNIVAETNRPYHRIATALEGGNGYDIAVGE